MIQHIDQFTHPEPSRVDQVIRQFVLLILVNGGFIIIFLRGDPIITDPNDQIN